MKLVQAQAQNGEDLEVDPVERPAGAREDEIVQCGSPTLGARRDVGAECAVARIVQTAAYALERG